MKKMTKRVEEHMRVSGRGGGGALQSFDHPIKKFRA